MGDLFELLATFLLIGANAFFVAAEFSLISARRDRLDGERACGAGQLPSDGFGHRCERQRRRGERRAHQRVV